MKNKILLVVFFIAYMVLYPMLAVAIDNTHWIKTVGIKTYIPSNHKRTLMMKHAFARWSKATQNKIVFYYVPTPESANVVVEFVEIIPNADREIGLTKFLYNPRNNSMIHAKIYIAEKTSSGRQLNDDSVFTVMIHEIGHAIGIANHSSNPKSIMHATEDDIQEILKSDIDTLAKIYKW